MALAPHPIISLLFHLLLDLLMSLFQDLPVLWRTLLALVLLFLQNISSSSYHRLHTETFQADHVHHATKLLSKVVIPLL